jgi:ATP-binding cassette, subfamily B (MDR/TAP), member 1
LPLSSLLVCIQMGIGQASSFAPDYQKASKAALGIVELLDSTSEIDPEVTTGSPIQGQGQGKADSDNGGNAESRMDGNGNGNADVDIEFRNIYFTYATRPDLPIFNNFSLRIPSGKTLAIVGSSGSGKSTLVSLLLRFYDVDKGSILLDGQDIRAYNLQQYRSIMGLVQQVGYSR